MSKLSVRLESIFAETPARHFCEDGDIHELLSRLREQYIECGLPISSKERGLPFRQTVHLQADEYPGTPYLTRDVVEHLNTLQ